MICFCLELVHISFTLTKIFADLEPTQLFWKIMVLKLPLAVIIIRLMTWRLCRQTHGHVAARCCRNMCCRQPCSRHSHQRLAETCNKIQQHTKTFSWVPPCCILMTTSTFHFGGPCRLNCFFASGRVLFHMLSTWPIPQEKLSYMSMHAFIGSPSDSWLLIEANFIPRPRGVSDERRVFSLTSVYSCGEHS